MVENQIARFWREFVGRTGFVNGFDLLRFFRIESKPKPPDLKNLKEFEAFGGINTSYERIYEHVRINIRRQLPQAKGFQLQDKKVIIAGGGPSLKACWPDLKAMYDGGLKVVTVNNVHDYCIANGVRPSLQVQLDARPFNARFCANPIPTCKYFLASQTHPDCFDLLKDNEVHIFHCDMEDVEKILDEYYLGRYNIIVGGSTVMLRAIMLTRLLGYQQFEIFGFDSCLLGGEHHSYEQKENDKTPVFKLYCDDKEFMVSGWMGKQALDFQKLVEHCGHLFKCNVHGDGLIAHIMKTGYKFRKRQIKEIDSKGEANGR